MLKTQPIASAQKVLRVLKALRGHSLNGVTNQQLAQQLNESPSTVTRALQTLVVEGIAEKRPDGTFALSIALLQIAESHREECARATARLAEINQRVTARSYY